uniref:Portal protein n=1 Tax=viral metagenome TaxID=1070528 RepID=A0A6M3M5H8_9ZZZZ
MAEIKRSRSDYMRRVVSNWLMPPKDREFYHQVDQEVAGLVLKLQRANQQINVLTEDVGIYKSHAWANLASGDYNPEEISYDEYKKMLNYDAQVIAGFDIIQMGVLMKPWKIMHPDPKIVDVLTAALRRMRYPTIREAMKEMMKAIPYGFTTTELVFGDYKKFWMPRRVNGLKTFDPEYIRFYSDPYGNLTKIEEQIGGERIPLPLNRTLVWSHDREWGNWYGKSILRGCYKNWFIKDAMLKFANIAYERFGSPILLGTAANVGDMQTIGAAIEHLFARSQAVIRKVGPDDPTNIEVLESKRATMPFEQYIKYHDGMILRRMLIGEPIFSGGGSTYSSKVPLDLLMMRFADFRLELTNIIDIMLQTITDLNWSVDVYPKFVFEPLTTLDQEAVIQKIFNSIDRRVIYIDEPWIREDLMLPPATDEIKKRLEEDARRDAEVEPTKEEP